MHKGAVRFLEKVFPIFLWFLIFRFFWRHRRHFLFDRVEDVDRDGARQADVLHDIALEAPGRLATGADASCLLPDALGPRMVGTLRADAHVLVVVVDRTVSGVGGTVA